MWKQFFIKFHQPSISLEFLHLCLSNFLKKLDPLNYLLKLFHQCLKSYFIFSDLTFFLERGFRCNRWHCPLNFGSVSTIAMAEVWTFKLRRAHLLKYSFICSHMLNMRYNLDLIIKTYKPYTLVGPAGTRLVQDPLAVKLLGNRLYIVPWKIVETIFCCIHFHFSFFV